MMPIAEQGELGGEVVPVEYVTVEDEHRVLGPAGEMDGCVADGAAGPQWLVLHDVLEDELRHRGGELAEVLGKSFDEDLETRLSTTIDELLKR